MVRVMTAQPSSPVDRSESPDRVEAPTTGTTRPASTWRARLGDPPRGPLVLGVVASLLMVVGGFGAAGVLVDDPLLTNSPVGFWRYGHGREIANSLIYLGVGLLAWAWVRLGRDVLARRVGGRAVLTTATAWLLPMLVAPPLFTRDVFSYLAQGALPLHGFDPYAVGPEALPGIFTDNVHYFWQDTPAPYGPLFILYAKAIAWLAGDQIILGVVLMRLALVVGLVLLVRALPELSRRMGGRPSLALWIVVANPVMVIHMVGGGHNDLLVMGLLTTAALAALRGQHAWGIVLATLGMAVKASAGVALPFLVLVWAGTMAGTVLVRTLRATAYGVAIFTGTFALCTVAAGVGLGWLPALSAPSMIVNWMSLPTGAGQLVHSVVSIFGPVSMQPFVNVGRAIGALILLVIAVRQWWAARDGGPDAVRRAGIVLLAVALLSPTTLPWYVSWGMALLAMVDWTPRALQILVFFSLWLMVVYYPDGEAALYDLAVLGIGAVLAALAAVSLLKPDPLGLSRRPVAVDPLVR
ncbi:polyprenol phosphomannose-dependent alpha 1,6 mannosyltransferase MptB [Pseudonocardia sp. KRD-169]|uniref:Polyprenol phosphomannose-dependent alpha 1,6 mannosyltransferase MptB n=2 Tax=Pseudonocardia abyssalis TaxID=2792008 RepID=A0ABS6UMB0_9PSEU|nr:polyprenol phosphomannose-dependent alpha 1,6 mannosyltransferase MptB [Pseudonocardia abyssalis]MBW0133387.1 polyprenol phosphomannose-dependent alpha 1,6 mannosyltransferase MptB [Pseudonocardia abyssalis]